MSAFKKEANIIVLELRDASFISTAEAENHFVKTASCPDFQTHFEKLASELKIIAPKAEEFLYFTAVMMHAAEASAINPDGSPKKHSNGSGEDVWVKWAVTRDGGIKFVSNDPSIKAYRNSRHDIFPESELKIAHEKWRGKPLCVDHKSDSIDHVRGFIVDTQYDYKLKRVVALCALDQKTYPDLARKVATGYSSDVSMGTGVGKAVCYDCGKVARAEKDFCDHMRYKDTYGEINMELEPIELSIVVIGADCNAKIKHIIAASQSMEKYLQDKEQQLIYQSKQPLGKIAQASYVKNVWNILADSVREVDRLTKIATEEVAEEFLQPGNISGFDQIKPTAFIEDEQVDGVSQSVPPAKIANDIFNMMEAVKGVQNRLQSFKHQAGLMTTTRKNAFYNGTEVPTPGKPQYASDPATEKAREEDAKRVEDATNGQTGIFSGDAEKKDAINRTASRADSLKNAKASLKSKHAFFNGTEEPTPGKPKYPSDPMAEKAREEDAKRVSDATNGQDGLAKGDAEKKDAIGRTASYKAVFVRPKTASAEQAEWHIKDKATDAIVVRASVKTVIASGVADSYKDIATKEFGNSLLGTVKAMGPKAVANMFKLAQDAAPAPAPAAPPPPSGEPMPGEAKPAADTDGDKDGDPKEKIKDTVDVLEESASDLKELINQEFGDKEQMHDVVQAAAHISSFKQSFAAYNVISDDLIAKASALVSQIKSQASELEGISDLYDELPPSQHALIHENAEAAIDTAKDLYTDATVMIDAFAKYAESNAVLRKAAQDALESMDMDTSSAHAHHQVPADDSLSGDVPVLPFEDETGDKTLEGELPEELHHGDDAVSPDDIEDEIEAEKEVDPRLVSASARNELRMKLAADCGEILESAHPKNNKVNDLEEKSDLVKVETQSEHQDEVLANVKDAVKIRREAEALRRLVLAGNITHSEIFSHASDMIAEGVDPKAIAYYKEMFGSDAESKDFAKELTAEHAQHVAKASLAMEMEKFKRAYKMASDAASRGLISNTPESISNTAENYSKLEDAALDEVRNIIAATNPLQMSVKTASAMPLMGAQSDSNVQVSSGDMKSRYEYMLKSNRKMNF